MRTYAWARARTRGRGVDFWMVGGGRRGHSRSLRRRLEEVVLASFLNVVIVDSRHV